MLDQTRGLPDPSPRRERIFNIPPAILITLVGLAIIHVIRLVVPEAWDEEILLRLAFVPGRLTYAVDPVPVLDSIRAALDQGDAGLPQAQFGRYILMNTGLQPWTALTYALLHADWSHIGLNGVWLLAFGSPVARRLGTGRFALFMAATTLAGAVAHFVAYPVGLVPVIGDSAAVSGCMGAALRFMFQPQVPVSSIIGLDRTRSDASHPPLVTFRALLGDRRAVAFLVVWFLANSLYGLGIVALGTAGATIAWQAHIGGFLMGLLGLRLFERGLGGAPPGPSDLTDEDPPRPVHDDPVTPR